MPVCGIWAQDWEGINVTSSGSAWRWNWEWHRALTRPDEAIRKLEAEGVRFLGYVNPYVAAGRSLFAEAAARGYLAKDGKGADYLVDFGEFTAGIVDFTDPVAFAWYKGCVASRGTSSASASPGWMADFGKYLPTDAVLASGESATSRIMRGPCSGPVRPRGRRRVRARRHPLVQARGAVPAPSGTAR